MDEGAGDREAVTDDETAKATLDELRRRLADYEPATEMDALMAPIARLLLAAIELQGIRSLLLKAEAAAKASGRPAHGLRLRTHYVALASRRSARLRGSGGRLSGNEPGGSGGAMLGPGSGAAWVVMGRTAWIRGGTTSRTGESRTSRRW